LNVNVGHTPTRCPYCHDHVGPEDENVVCNGCLARHHRACWDESAARCGTCGHSQAARTGHPEKGDAPTPSLPSATTEGLAPGLASRLESELERGEKLVWVGQPRPSLHARATLPIFLFAVPWTVFSVGWLVMATRGEGGLGILFFIFGLPFVWIGLSMLSTPYRALRAARETVYAITDRGVVIIQGGPGKSTVRRYGPKNLHKMTRTENADGSGNLIIETEVTRSSRGRESTTEHGFIGIERVHEVDALVRRAHLPGA
jgi:hypothetical protein